ncbi:hypothetical protein A9Q86_09920 [Flavobacteriales bacterium 33_180_T64]|nr:hypothetical protein A9Q86_09920 [Flavobacteriales bacterium 33_180_T64]
MNKNLLLFYLLISTFSYSQVQKRFYVNDAKTIDYVTVNFCVNDSARISKVTVLLEKTTYKNEEIIQNLITYLKEIQYYPDSKLRNNCYDSTFEFVNKNYENAELNESDYAKCNKFKTGNFRYADFRVKETKIKRRKNKQIEKNGKRNKDDPFKEKYKISWSSPCEYQLEFLTANSAEREKFIGESIKVKIIALIDNGYVFKAKLLDYHETINVILIDSE